jgi:hypothetical protein
MNQRTLLRQHYWLTYGIYQNELSLITLERNDKACTDIRLSSDETMQLYLDLEKYFAHEERAKHFERYKLRYQPCPF